ncbi:hypothetical protein MMC29_003202 [Sticta canariensis]|nr:hypothetical protein [Sticta canariensis]
MAATVTSDSPLLLVAADRTCKQKTNRGGTKVQAEPFVRPLLKNIALAKPVGSADVRKSSAAEFAAVGLGVICCKRAMGHKGLEQRVTRVARAHMRLRDPQI